MQEVGAKEGKASSLFLYCFYLENLCLVPKLWCDSECTA